MGEDQMDVVLTPPLESIPAGIPEIHGKNFWLRSLAYIIDFFVMYLLSYFSGYTGGIILGRILRLILPILGRKMYLTHPDFTIVNYIFGISLTIVYFFLFEWLFGRSFGKLILRMRVVSRDGKPCTLKQALVRSIYRIVDGLFFGLIAYQNMKPTIFQRLGDKKASTVVVSSRDAIIQDHPAWWLFVLALVIFVGFSMFSLMFITVLKIRLT